MNEPFLRDSERKLLKESIANCAQCRGIIERLQMAGLPQDARLQRIEAREKLARAVLDVDALSTQQQD